MKKNILIIDDSALMRRVLSDIINMDERFTVSDMATNGLEGFDLLVLNNQKYAAILLDINMPKMNGLEFMEQVNKRGIKATIIIVSTLAKEGAKETIRALELGAFDFVTKPDSFLEAKSESFKDKIIRCLEVATHTEEDTERNPKTLFPVRETVTKTECAEKKKKPLKKIGASKLVALACSTGGPKALQSVVPYLPANLDASVLIVQHMPEGFTNSLAVRLNEMSKIRVKEAEDGEIIEKGCVYIAKGGKQMRLIQKNSRESKISLGDDPPRGGLRPCADIMYESLVNTHFDEITCVVLTGMGADGTRGIKQLNESVNIYVIAQDELTSTVYGMPKVITESGLVDEVQPISAVANAIAKNVGVR